MRPSAIFLIAAISLAQAASEDEAFGPDRAKSKATSFGSAKFSTTAKGTAASARLVASILPRGNTSCFPSGSGALANQLDSGGEGQRLDGTVASAKTSRPRLAAQCGGTGALTRCIFTVSNSWSRV